MEVGIGPQQTRRTGAFSGSFGESTAATFSFDVNQEQLAEITITRLGERKGKRGAVDPMSMEMMPSGQLPPADQLPGHTVGEAVSGDGKFVATILDQPLNGIYESGAYLAVSARTPYNRFPLPFMALSGTVSRNGTTVLEGPLQPTLDPTVNYHYGQVVDNIQSGDWIELRVGAPPQVARHEGYETAFFEMDAMNSPSPRPDYSAYTPLQIFLRT